MGEKKTRKERMKAQHPICCYCGHRPTVTTDHCPPIIMFSRKDRPKGFEFPACDECNRNSSVDDAVASLIFGLTISGNLESKVNKADVINRMRAVNIAAPNVLIELYGSPINRTIEKREVRSIGMDPQKVDLVKLGPISMKHLYNFSAKLTVAAYFNINKKICASETEVVSIIKLNHEILRYGIPKLPFEFQNYETLKQGKKDVSDQFGLAYNTNPDDGLGAFAFEFHRNALVFGMISEKGFGQDIQNSEGTRKIGNLFI